MSYQYNSDQQKMEAKKCQFNATLGNFEVTGTLLSGTKLKLEMVSLLDGRVYSVESTDETIDKAIKEFFGNVSNLYAVLEDQIKGKKDIMATDLGNLKFSIVIYKAGNTEIKKDFAIDMKEVEMDKFDRLERIVKKIATKGNQGLAGYTKLQFEPDKGTTAYANILQEGDVYSNKMHGSWMTLFGKNPIPEKGLYYFEIELVKWANKAIMVGIASQALRNSNTSFNQADNICLFMQNNNTSSLYDRNANTRMGSFGTFEQGDRITVKINRDTGLISWCFFNQTIAFTRIPKDLRLKQLFIKVEFMYNTEKIRFV